MACTSDGTRATFLVAAAGLLATLMACTDGPNLPSDEDSALLGSRDPQKAMAAPTSSTKTCMGGYISDGNGGCIYAPESPSGGYTYPYPPSSDDPGIRGGGAEPTDTADCATGDPIIDSPAVQAGFEDIWKRSNPEAPMSQRIERGGWVIRTATGYAFQAWPDVWSINQCGIDVPAGTMPPAGAVAWVHTHPYAYREKMTGCESLTLRVGGQLMTVYQDYLNQPSDYDGEVSTGWNLAGYVIDKAGISEFVGDPASQYKVRIVERVNRCGY